MAKTYFNRDGGRQDKEIAVSQRQMRNPVSIISLQPSSLLRRGHGLEFTFTPDDHKYNLDLAVHIDISIEAFRILHSISTADVCPVSFSPLETGHCR